jgi:hypothetical protein
VLFFTCITFYVGAFADSAIFVQSLPVWYKHRQAKFHPAFCFGLSAYLMRLPWIFVETWVWTLMVGDSDGGRLRRFKCWNGATLRPPPPTPGPAVGLVRAFTSAVCAPARLQVYFCVGFDTSARILAFWGTIFSLGSFALTLFLACAALMRNVAAATAVEVRRGTGVGVYVCM